MGKIRQGIAAIFADKKELGLITQKELAEAIGCTQPMVSGLLSGEVRLSDEWIEKLCEALGVTLADLEDAPQRTELPRELGAGLEKLKRLYELSRDPGFRNITNSIDDWLKILKSSPAKAPDDADLPRIPAGDTVFVDVGDGRPPIQISPTTKKGRKINNG